MTARDLIELAGAALAGAALGAAYFTGLWRTVRALGSARHPAVLALASFAIRFGAVVAVFVFVTRAGGWPAASAAVAGFIVTRTVVMSRFRSRGAGRPEAAR
jgi:F1F0 ATPase subunit 2